MKWTDATYRLILHADIRFTEMERRAILEACDEWLRFTKQRMLFEVVFDYDRFDVDLAMSANLILKAKPKFHLIKEYDKEYNCHAIGLCFIPNNHQYILLMVDGRLPNYTVFKTTTMHELGHVLGMCHTEPDSIMQPHNTTLNFTERDAQEFCRVHGCALSDLDYSKTT